MSKGPADPFCTIVGGLPPWMTQELAQAFKLHFGHLLLDSPEGRGSVIVRIRAPGLTTSPRIGQGAAFAVLLCPEAIPVYEEGTCNTESPSRETG